MNKPLFDNIEQTLRSEGATAALSQLVDHLRAERRPHELFEALKMQFRHRLGLPLMFGDNGDDASESLREQTDDALLKACREVGLMLLEDGRVRDGWAYLRPLGERQEAAELLLKIEPDDENLDELIEVSLQEGVDVERGFRLVLEHHGTCNAITTFEAAMHGRTFSEQQAAARLLLRHVHQELLGSVRADIERQKGAHPSETTLAELVAEREWLFAEHAYHIDTTHLLSTVRFARLLGDAESLRLADDLTEYGRRLSEQFQYPGDEPFADHYVSHGLYFRAMLDKGVDEAIDYFRGKAEELDIDEHGLIAIEVYVDLLARLDKPKLAIDEALRLSPEDARPMGLAPSLLELSQRAGDYNQMLARCRQRDDVLGYTVGLLSAHSQGK